jgi:hypothetical protein
MMVSTAVHVHIVVEADKQIEADQHQVIPQKVRGLPSPEVLESGLTWQ